MPKVKTIQLSRLFNLGNYEHVRYEIGVELEQDDDPTKTLTDLEAVMEGIGCTSGVSIHELDRARKALNSPASDLSEYEISNLPAYRDRVNRDDEARKRREWARRELAKLGGSTHYHENPVDNPWGDE